MMEVDDTLNITLTIDDNDMNMNMTMDQEHKNNTMISRSSNGSSTKNDHYSKRYYNHILLMALLLSVLIDNCHSIPLPSLSLSVSVSPHKASNTFDSSLSSSSSSSSAGLDFIDWKSHHQNNYFRKIINTSSRIRSRIRSRNININRRRSNRESRIDNENNGTTKSNINNDNDHDHDHNDNTNNNDTNDTSMNDNSDIHVAAGTSNDCHVILDTSRSTSSSSSSLSSTTTMEEYPTVTNNNALVLESSSSSSSSLWPPWPFSLLQKQKLETQQQQQLSNGNNGSGGNSNRSIISSYSNSSRSAALFFMTYLRQKAKIGLGQMGQVTTAISYHLPPAAPPIFLLAILPTNKLGSSTTTAAAAAASISSVPNVNNILNLNIIARKLAFASFGIAILSWADYEIRKKKRLTPLPLFYYSTIAAGGVMELIGSSSGSSGSSNGNGNGSVSNGNGSNGIGGGNGNGNAEKGEDTLMITTLDLKNVILPPFLPEEVIIDDHNEYENGNDDDYENQQQLQQQQYEEMDEHNDSQINDDNTMIQGNNQDQETMTNSNNNNDDKDKENDTILSSPLPSILPSISSSTIPTMKNNIYDFCQTTIPILLPKPKTSIAVIRSWFKMKQIKKQQELQNKRQSIMNELIDLQNMKRKRIVSNTKNWKKKNLNIKRWSTSGSRAAAAAASVAASRSKTAPLGYALITGASRGIGRAFAIELARYEIPLILIARDEEKLSSLALDIQTAYGVPCIVIKADLSKHGTARQIYETTQKAGMKVDILINNAGVCTTRDLICSKEEDIERMMNVNVASTTMLSHLYAKEMKESKRGRILFVSSMVAAVPSGPGVATYAATKAYEKSLAQSMGRELEKYGVGVTCLMPGAVKDTSFALRSDAHEAICFKVPFYPMKAQHVASSGVRSLLLSGDGEVVTGWSNRLFLKLFMPILPPRLTSSIVAFAWSPLRLPFGIGGNNRRRRDEYDDGLNGDTITNNYGMIESSQERISNILNGMPPRVLELSPKVEIKREEVEIIKSKKQQEGGGENIMTMDNNGNPVIEEQSNDEDKEIESSTL